MHKGECPMIDTQKLKCLRISRRKTQEEVACALNISTATYSRYERGLSSIPSDTLKNLAEYFETSIDSLYL